MKKGGASTVRDRRELEITNELWDESHKRGTYFYEVILFLHASDISFASWGDCEHKTTGTDKLKTLRTVPSTWQALSERLSPILIAIDDIKF